jgi:enoyl-CoA hydratase/carnithine racemase
MSNGNPADRYDEGAVLLDQRGAIALITLTRPAVFNALTWTMYGQLEAHLEHVAVDDSIHSIIIQGEARHLQQGRISSNFKAAQVQMV